ncbi:hypothetical protein BDV38DRAFT_296000 [Aspergillus pseudotamarii]|uniref:Phytanoyl-CoA dioxygenase n=1 Tax=Aspergillus pseudotamarii TaxID=132259 RepID=A0A5N6SI74_ASPPS|nr:uncharacterized protein BDV38DRAFT_296000 [Aspergillus pseudotamarii]KAE8133607.1 hypothetical protein BDV38DRAFT_296000 [Aspergillus pseudotamarii]
MPSTLVHSVQQKLNLRAYEGTIENLKSLKPFTPDTPLAVKSLIGRNLVNKCRRDYLGFVHQGSGVLKPGTIPQDSLKDEGPFVENTVESHVAPFCLNFKDEIAKQMEAFYLPRSLLQCTVPGAESTPVHYTQIFLRSGPPTSVTAWVPIGDIEKDGEFTCLSIDLSEEKKVSHVNRNMNAGGWLDRNSSQFGKNWGRNWLVGEYGAGDVVFHNPHMIHAGPINELPKGRIRVSTDLRCVDTSKPFEERWTFPAFSESDPNLAHKLKLSA